MPRIQHKRGTSANLASVNPTPLAGELVWDSSENAIKIGDGATAWTSLAYVTATPRSHTHALSQLTDFSAPPGPVSNRSFLSYNQSSAVWSPSTNGGQINIGAFPLGGWPSGSIGEALAGKVDTSDARLTDARTPTAHKASHATGGSDALSPSDIGAAPAASPAITGNATFGASSGVPVTITNTGTGNSFVVNDAAGDTTPFTINAAGWVGINVDTPSAPLNVASESTASGAKTQTWAYFLNNDTYNLRLTTAVTSGVVRWVFNQTNNSTDYPNVLCFDRGNIGIGTTSPASRLDVNGVITVAATSGSAGSYAPSLTFSGDSNTGFGQVSGQSDTASVFTAGQERVRVDASGNIEAGPNKRTIGVSSRMHISADNANWGTPLCVVCDSVGRGPVVVSADYSPNPDVGSQLYFNASTGGFTIGCSSPGNSALGSVTFSASQIVTPAGTAAAPAIVASGDSNTGAFFPAADTFAISTAGSERLRVDSSGRVGIGVTPTAPLHVKSSSGETLRLESTASGNGYVQFVNTSGSMSFGMTGSASNRVLLYDRTNNQSAYDYLGGASGVHRFFTNDTHRMSVKATGAVRFVPLSADPASGEAGDVYYNSSTNKLRVYNGTSWIDLH